MKIFARIGFHKSSPSSIPQGYVEVVPGVESAVRGLLCHVLAVCIHGHVGGGNRCGGDTL